MRELVSLRIWGPIWQANIARMRTDVMHFLQAVVDVELKTSVLQMISVIKDYKSTVKVMHSYLTEMFFQDIQGNERSLYLSTFYYPYSKDESKYDCEKACRAMLLPLILMIQKRQKEIEKRYISLFNYESKSQDTMTDKRANASASLVHIAAEIRELGKKVSARHDYCVTNGQEEFIRSEKTFGNSIHDVAFNIYVELKSIDGKLAVVGDAIHDTTSTEKEFNLVMDADKLSEVKYSATTDGVGDFQMYRLDGSLSETRDSDGSDGGARFLKYVHSLNIIETGGFQKMAYELEMKNNKGE